MMTSAFAQMFNDELHAYQDHYDSAASLRRALQDEGITFGTRGLGSSTSDMPMYDDNGKLSANNRGAYHEEIFYDDSGGNLHSVGYFKGGMQYDTELSDDAIRHYRFEPVQHYTVGPMISFYWQQPDFRADNYHLLTHNCQDYAEHMRNVLGLNSYI